MGANPQYENIPAPMRALPCWTFYRVEPPKKPGLKPQKVPYQGNGQHASSTNPATWVPFETVQNVPAGFNGINFAFRAADGLFCIDLDHARNPETGEPHPWAREIIQRANTYTEISASGTGYHIIGYGTIPKNYKCGEIEIYNDKKFISVTGDVYDFRFGIESRDLTWLIESLKPAEPAPVHVSSGDPSKDDFALAAKLARQFDCDFEKTKAAFLEQAPARPKLRRADYVERTVKNAIARVLTSKPLVQTQSTNSQTVSFIGGETFDSIQEKPLLWLWKNRIPKNKIAIFGGNPDAGKSLVSLDLSARLSKGHDFPDGERNELGPVDVALLFCEDDKADTVKPRLLAAGADCSKVHRIFATKVEKDGTKAERHIAFDTDLRELESYLLEHPAIRFLVVDPISNYLGEASMVKETDVRRVLVPLAELASRLEITVVLIAHLNKRSDVSALHKIMGAVAISGVARAAWMFAEDPDDEGAYLMVRGKLNVGKKTEGLRYSIKAKDIPNCGEAPFINWNGTTDVSAGQVLGLFGPMQDSGKATKRSDAATWLKGYLSAGRKPSEEIFEAAKRQGIAANTLRRAKKELGVDAEQAADGWYWKLPEPSDAQQADSFV